VEYPQKLLTVQKGDSPMASEPGGRTFSLGKAKGGTMKQILIATDGSPSAQEAVDVGLELAKEQGADVTFVHVTPADAVRGGRGGAHALTHSEEIDESETPLKAAGEAAEAAGVSYGLEHFSGETVETIVALADAKNADMIVVGNRGRNAVAAALLGSVSRGVLDQAKRPVLIVKSANVAVESTA
jgi:nucleotide-binding universal stress UspA family protein